MDFWLENNSNLREKLELLLLFKDILVDFYVIKSSKKRESGWLIFNHVLDYILLWRLIILACRVFLAKRVFIQLRRNKKATVIQKVFRGHIGRGKAKGVLRRIIVVQSCWRRHKARQELKHLRIEARSVSKIQQKAVICCFNVLIFRVHWR